MMCKLNVLWLCVFVHTWNKVYASIVQLNETKHASLPPLYSLEDWSTCQGAHDAYCIVDAVLTSGDDTALMQFLKEYSNQTLKHYNRTLVHRGVCVTRCSGQHGTVQPGDWRSAAQLCINSSVQQYGLQAEVVSVEWCVAPHSAPRAAAASSRALAIFCIVVVVITALATALHLFSEKWTKTEGNKYLLAFSVRRNWSILTYDRSKPRMEKRMKDIACMEGIRFLGTIGVIFSHVLFIYIYSYVDNPLFVEKMYDQFSWQIVFNSPLWLQSFFCLSGFLTTYSILIVAEKNPFTLLKSILAVINRWIRLTPVAAFSLWFTMEWFPLLGSGPQWSWLVTREATDCTERWWYHLLYIHNHLPLGKMCMGHTWYLAADMQLHIFGVMVLFLILRYRKMVLPVLLAMVVASPVAAGLVVYWHQLTPIITAQSPEALRTLFGASKVIPLLYIPSWMNLSGYACGMAVAFILQHNQAAGVKLNEQKWFNIIFHLSLHIGGCVVLCGVVFLTDHPLPSWASAVYSSLDRTSVAICFSVFMLGCFSRCTSAVRDALEWRGFHLLGRLSYCAFLIHFIVLRLTLAANTQLGHASIFSLICILISTTVLTFIASMPLCLLIELPAIQLWKALVDGDIATERAPVSEGAQLPVKPFDLVAHVRRHEI